MEVQGLASMIRAYTTDGKPFVQMAMQKGDGEGASYQPKGGPFYLNVAGNGNWTIMAVQLP